MHSTSLRLAVLGLSLVASAFSPVAFAHEGDDEGHTRMIRPEEEQDYLNSFWSIFATSPGVRYRFQQTTWGECSEAISGNYSGYNCSDRRAISVILKKFMGDNIYTCINKGLAAQGGGYVADLHIEHNGITGDANHSPRSLHAENRAIDIKAFDMKLADGRVKKFVYAGTANRAFYTAFRKCWGEVVKTKNGCPYYAGNNVMYTGSIGWEDANHRQHMHLSIPHCVGGKYTSSYYQR